MGEVFKLNHCYNVDCLPAMELFPDNYFDLAVVDPPYFSGPERRGFYGSTTSTRHSTGGASAAMRYTWEKACWCSACCMVFFQP